MTEPYDHSSAKEDARNDLLAGEEYDHSRAKEDRRNAPQECPDCERYEGCAPPDGAEADGEGLCAICHGEGYLP